MAKQIKIGMTVVCAVTLACLATACSDEVPASSEARGAGPNAPLASLIPDDLSTRGVVQVATAFGRAPLGFYADDNETVQGVDVDIAKALSEQLGIEFRMNDVAFANIIPGVENGKYDIVLSAMQITDERLTEVQMLSYLSDAARPLVRVGEEPDEGLCGATAGAVSGATTVDYLEEYSSACKAAGKEGVRISEYPDTASAVLALRSGRIDAVETSNSSASYIAGQSNGTLATFGEANHPLEYGIVFAQGQDEWAAAVKAALEALKEDGTYDSILEKWSVSDMSVDTYALLP